MSAREGHLLTSCFRVLSFGARDEDALTSLAGRLSRLDRELTDGDKKVVTDVTGGKPLRYMINGLLDAVDADRQVEKAQVIFNVATPSPEQVKKAGDQLVKDACAPFEIATKSGTLSSISINKVSRSLTM